MLPMLCEDSLKVTRIPNRQPLRERRNSILGIRNRRRSRSGGIKISLILSRLPTSIPLLQEHVYR